MKVDIYWGIEHCGNCVYFIQTCSNCGCGVCAENNDDRKSKADHCEQWRRK
jgi:hypothetical protein